MPGAVEFEHLLLAFQIVLLVVTGYAGVGYRLAAGVLLGPELLRAQFRKIVAAVAARRMIATSLPSASQRRSVVIDTPSTSAASPMPTNLSILEIFA